MGGHAVSLAVEAKAEALGAALAKKDYWTLSGARDEGVMRAVSKGASEAGGFVIGVHPGVPGDDDVADGLSLTVFTGMGFARNMINALTCDVLVAMPGAYGTMSEIAYAKTYNKPVVLYGFMDDDWFGDGVHRADTLDACLEAIHELLTTAGY